MSPAIPQEQQLDEVHEFVDAMVMAGWETVFVRPSQQTHWRCEFTRGGHRVQLLYGRIADAWSVVEPKPSPWTGAEEVLHLIERRYPKSAIPQEQRPLIDRMREAVPELEWRMSGSAVVGRDGWRNVVSANPRGSLLCWCKTKAEPHAVSMFYPGDDEAVRIVREWWVKVNPKRTPLERFREAIPELQWELAPDGGICGYRHSKGCTEISWAPEMEYLRCGKYLIPGSIRANEPIDDAIKRAREWYDATYPQHAPPSRTEALVEAIRAACPEVNAYSDDEAVRVFWGRMSWRFEPDGEHWKCGGTHCTERGAVHAIREHIDTHTLAEDQSLDGLFRREARNIEYAQKRGHTPGSVITGAPSMDTKTLTQTIKVDASEAAWRTAGSQFVKLAREPLVGLLQRHLAPGDDAFRARLAAFLETELGTALLASMLSASLSAMPQAAGDVPQKLARELRVRAMADAGEVLADVLMGPLRQVMALYLQDPQGAPQLGVAQTTAVDFAGVGAKEGVR